MVCLPFEKHRFAVFHWLLENVKHHVARIRSNTGINALHLRQKRQTWYKFFGHQLQPSKNCKANISHKLLAIDF